MPKYQLKATYWDGAQLHPRNSILGFAEGAAPKSAKLCADDAGAKEVEAAAAAEATKNLEAAKTSEGPKATVKKG